MTTRRGPKAERGELKDSILDAAAGVFADRGFEAATMQAIADAAGVDKKLVHYYFGAKDDLFVAMLDRTFARIDGAGVLADALADPSGPAIRDYVTRVLGAVEDPGTGSALVSVLRSLATYPPAAEAFLAFIAGSVMPVAGGAAGGPADAQLRLSAAGSQLLGFLTGRYVLRAPALAALPLDAAADVIAPALAVTLAG